MVSITTGLAGGFVATIVMTAFMMALGDDSPPPTARLWSKYVGDRDPEAYMAHGMVLHFLYGSIAGGVFAVALVADVLGDVTLTTAVGGGIGYGILLLAVGAGFWMRVVLGMDPDAEALTLFSLFHVVYGLVLGTVAFVA